VIREMPEYIKSLYEGGVCLTPKWDDQKKKWVAEINPSWRELPRYAGLLDRKAAK
jgi:hypothetical protein